MGAGQSIPQSLPSVSKYTNQVIPTQVLVNEIFMWMMSQIDTNDLLKLANPKHCKDYVFLTRDALDVFMRKIQLEPKLGAKDTLYFSSVRDLTFADEKTAQQRPTQKLYRDTLCSQLAFFYVRIFQVFGALALTVIEPLPDVQTKPQYIARVLGQGKAMAPAPLFAARGGAKITQGNANNLGEFYDYAKSYFLKMDNQEDVYIIAAPTSYGRKIYQPQQKEVIYFKPSLNRNIYYLISDNTIEARILITSASRASYTLVIDNILLNDEDINVSYNVLMTYKVNDYLYGRKNFYTVLSTLLNYIPRPTLRDKSVEELLGEKRIEQAEAKVDEAGIPEGLSYSKIQEYLKKTPKAYCVARAIQLLSPTIIEGYQKTTRYTSDICYFDTTAPYMKDSVPLFGHSITENSPGLRALNQLFYDVLRGLTPAMSQEADARYKEFLNIMQVIFSPKKPTKELKTLKDVKSAPFQQCEDPEAKNKTIVLTTHNSIREIQKSVAELLNYQMSHTATVSKFLQKLFLIDKSRKVLGINPIILKGGISSVNRLAEEARTILTEYYKFCEGTYRLGALKVLSAQQKLFMERK